MQAIKYDKSTNYIYYPLEYALFIEKNSCPGNGQSFPIGYYDGIFRELTDKALFEDAFMDYDVPMEVKIP
ncbi:hypothetical protein [Sporosarcina pasteurii]|uniref:hypothetical protein n=1 Tax=Sporosarcina pasteurii TaxID=1474 RepID=UPI000E1BC6CC|nr:hypothetical protein [Sporosarcina pasteurii]MDS9471207.1 hypothetical protein [Sporosarcina pasteurii]QBQ05157.1 hypothetical protein E2C16_05490 [Sporosarcina pasteurii]